MQWPLPQFPTRMDVEYASLFTGSPNVKGSWETISFSIPFEVGWVSVNTPNVIAAASTDTRVCLDLAVGSTVVLENLLLGHRLQRPTCFPLRLPADATLRGRVSGAQSAALVNVQVALYGGEPDSGLAAPSRITTYGASASGGTPFSVGVGNQSGWIQLTSSTTSPIHALMVAVQGPSGTGMSTSEFSLDIAVGPSGSERLILRDLLFRTDSGRGAVFPASPDFHPLSTTIPAGSRLAARATWWAEGSAAGQVAVYGSTY